MSTRERILAAEDSEKASRAASPVRNRDDVIAGLLMSAQASLAAAQRLLSERLPDRPEPGKDLVEPEACEHPPGAIIAVGGFGDDPGQRFCRACGTEVE